MTENVKVADTVLRDNPRSIRGAREQRVHVSGCGVSLVSDCVGRERDEVRVRFAEGEVDELFAVEQQVFDVDPIAIRRSRQRVTACCNTPLVERSLPQR